MASVPPSLPIRVNVAHKMDDDRVVAISTDGEIVVIESDLQSFSQPKTPFPASRNSCESHVAINLFPITTELVMEAGKGVFG